MEEQTEVVLLGDDTQQTEPPQQTEPAPEPPVTIQLPWRLNPHTKTRAGFTKNKGRGRSKQQHKREKLARRRNRHA